MACVEAGSAFARRNRGNSLLDEQHRQKVAPFNTNWTYINRVPVTDAIAYAAGNLAEQYALRGFDAIHLASAMSLVRHLDDLHFLTFDERLMNAARQMMPVYEIE